MTFFSALWFPFKCFANKNQAENYTKGFGGIVKISEDRLLCASERKKLSDLEKDLHDFQTKEIAPHEISRKLNNSFHCVRCFENSQSWIFSGKTSPCASVWMTQHIFQLPAEMISSVDVDSASKGIKFVVLSDMRQVTLRRISRWGFFSGPFCASDLDLFRDLGLVLNVLLVYLIIFFLGWNMWNVRQRNTKRNLLIYLLFDRCFSLLLVSVSQCSKIYFSRYFGCASMTRNLTTHPLSTHQTTNSLPCEKAHHISHLTFTLFPVAGFYLHWRCHEHIYSFSPELFEMFNEMAVRRVNWWGWCKIFKMEFHEFQMRTQNISHKKLTQSRGGLVLFVFTYATFTLDRLNS